MSEHCPIAVTVWILLGDLEGCRALDFRILLLGSCPFRSSRDAAIVFV